MDLQFEPIISRSDSRLSELELADCPDDEEVSPLARCWNLASGMGLWNPNRALRDTGSIRTVDRGLNSKGPLWTVDGVVVLGLPFCSVHRAFFEARLQGSIAGIEEGPGVAVSMPGRSLIAAADCPASVAGLITRVGFKAKSEDCAAGVEERDFREAEDCPALVAGLLVGYLAKSSDSLLVRDSKSD